MDECTIATFLKVIFEVLPGPRVFAPRSGSGISPNPGRSGKHLALLVWVDPAGEFASNAQREENSRRGSQV